jgi:CDP-glucose 4,6-dehydratase
LAERLTNDRATRIRRETNGPKTPRAFNFGPDPESFLTVAQVVDTLTAALNKAPGSKPATGRGWDQAPGIHLPEAAALTLSSELAQRSLGWRPKLTMQETIDWTAEWYVALAAGGDARTLTSDQIRKYQARCAV